MKCSKTRILFLIFVLVSWSSVEALAQPRIIVAFAPGGPVDSLARALASEPAMAFFPGRSVAVDNRPGSGGSIGTEYARVQPGDGSVLLLTFITYSGNTGGIARYAAALAGFVPLAYLGSLANQKTGNKSWYGIYGPPGMSRETANRLEPIIRSALQGDEFSRRVGQLNGWVQDRDTSAATLAQATADARSLATTPDSTARPAAPADANRPMEAIVVIPFQGASSAPRKPKE